MFVYCWPDDLLQEELLHRPPRTVITLYVIKRFKTLDKFNTSYFVLFIMVKATQSNSKNDRKVKIQAYTSCRFNIYNIYLNKTYIIYFNKIEKCS